ncbi:type II toxin-antitoxin system RatA family toxin [Sphingomonas jatrophae]|uniref:Coenzyme Q-binding protein COQ10 n=1 Tax=Sphingomonas jatrophae TaxID=1166337 RepID=A0A1I6JP78_9SPHN|nr:type II toxin-antitoxin system RatA family toxin [Sphingomonas jatrophae]SFR80744.1 coenzyme Q-binding protein COQ10 [Sphingomonas jatrophae]
MPRHAETRILPYTPEQLFDLVADVARYKEFLPWVAAVRVRSDSATEMVADVVVGFKALRERFTSRVHKERPNHIHVEYVDGPLEHLSNDWKFRRVEGGTAVEFCVDFAFKSRIFEAVAGQMFGMALRRMIGAFEARAAALYGPGEPGISSSSAQSAA